jgi:uncharacterized protein
MMIVSDTSPISNLIQINRLDILESLFQEIVIPPKVHDEIEQLTNFGVNLTAYYSATWIRKEHPYNSLKLASLKTIVDEGESEAIVLAQELGATYLLIDERIGTKIAHQEGLQTIGLIGVLIKAKMAGFVSSVMPIVEDLENIAGFWVGERLKNLIRNQVNE